MIQSFLAIVLINFPRSWGCDCEGCDCSDVLDLGSINNVPGDYSCAPTDYGGGLTCDEMAYFGFSCHFMETSRAADCSGCLCEEAILGYEKGDGTCPMSCRGSNCHAQTEHLRTSFSKNFDDTFDVTLGCDCSGCNETQRRWME